ncbi:MAG TPA: endonuclease domain-containing protein [Polyangiaceae bacterium]|nr:endonuclease domain-containing protein [Polyangiaceae bacterium]
MLLRPDAPLSLITQRARAMRRAPTRSEAILWNALRGKRMGARWRRQHPFGVFICDFYCASSRLVVEVDGGVHLDLNRRFADERRQAAIEAAFGVRFLRLSAELVEGNLSRALAMIRATM